MENTVDLNHFTTIHLKSDIISRGLLAIPGLIYFRILNIDHNYFKSYDRTPSLPPP